MSGHSSATGAAIVLVLFILLVIILIASWLVGTPLGQPAAIVGPFL
ncbi:hypothetical protein VQL36_13415 [Chengkuizengella sp. SCS-71B]